MTRNTYTQRAVMHKAWGLAKNAANTFGGKARDYIRETLKDAWKAVKADPVAKAAAEIVSVMRNENRASLTRKQLCFSRAGSFWNPW